MAEPGDPHSPQDGPPEVPTDGDLFRDDIPASRPQSQRPTWAAPVRPVPEAAVGSSPETDPHAHDDLIGFTSPASLAGTERRPAVLPPVSPEPARAPEPASEAVAGEPVIPALPEPDPLILAPKFTGPEDTRRAPGLAPTPVPAWAVKTPLDATPVATPVGERSFGRAATAKAAVTAPEGATGLYTIYALILFAVPTFGVAAMIGLFMVWTKARPDQPLARSHFEFQTRTLWIAAVAAAVGVVLIAVNLGVFVLFLMAVWVIVRGAWGVMTLAAGKPVRNPRSWLI